MDVTTNDLISTTLWQSYVGAGAPSNASGQRTGYGVTKRTASADASHWNNQAPYERFRRVWLTDCAKPSEYSESYELAVSILRYDADLEEFGEKKEREGAARRREFVARGRYASAVLDLLRERGEAE